MYFSESGGNNVLEFIAEIYFFELNNNAIYSSGMMPSFNMDGELIASRMLSNKPMNTEEWHEVIIQLPYGGSLNILETLSKMDMNLK